jgi:hypothetical protein
MQSESSTNDIQKSPDWEKVEKPAPAPLGPQERWGDSSATYGPFPPTSPGYSGASEKEVEHNSMSWTACYDDGCFVHLSEKQGRWFPKEPKKHTTKRNLPYATQPSPPPPPPPHLPPKPKHGNSREVHAKKVSWDKCSRKGCKVHKEEKRRNETVKTRFGGEGDKKLQEWGNGEETEVDDEGTLQWADMLQQRHIMRETIRLQDETIKKQQETIEQQRVAIEVGTTTIAMLKRQWQAEEGINKRLRKELKRTGRFLSELGR